MTRRVKNPFLWNLLLVLPLLAGCPGKGAAADQDENPLAEQDFSDSANVSDDGTDTETDEEDDISFEADQDTVEQDTTVTCDYVALGDIDGDAAEFAGEAHAIVRVTADKEVPGDVTVTLRLRKWVYDGFGAILYAVLRDLPDGTVAFARQHDVTVDEETRWTTVTILLSGSDIGYPGHEGANLVIVPMGVHLEGQTSADGVEDPDVEAGDEVETECRLTSDEDAFAVDASCELCLEPGDWETEPGADPCETFSFEQIEEGIRYTIVSECETATADGPTLNLTAIACTLSTGDVEIVCEDEYEVHVLTEATCAGNPPVTLQGIILPDGTEHCPDLFPAGSQLQGNGSGPVLVTVAYKGGVVIADLTNGTVLNTLDYLQDSPLGSVPMSFIPPSPGTRVDALVSYYNNGYGITHYDPVAGIFGATEVDPSSGSVSDADTYEEDPSRAVLVQSGNNRVRFIEIVTPPFSGPRFTALDPFIKSIPSTLFPGATGFVITATRRNDTSPVYFVTVGATPAAAGSLWRKNDPADLSTPATLVGSVGAFPRRIRFAGTVGVVSNSQSNTLTILVRDASDNVTIKGTVDVADGPIGVDLLVLPDGNIGVLSTGFRDHTYTITILEPDGDIVSNDTFPVPGGGLKPAHAVWANAEGTRIAVSCNGSDEVRIFSIG